MKKPLIKRLLMALFGGFFVFINLFGLLTPNLASAAEAAEPVESVEATVVTTEQKPIKVPNTGEEAVELTADDLCSEELGSMSWRICPETDKVSQAADWIYDKIEQVLVINPIEAQDGSPIYEIWKYCRGLTNIIFIIFLLVVIYSQITGMGINNYGLKKALPKLIIAAVLVNLSFIICSLAIDVSNIIGTNLRNLFISVEASATSGKTLAELSATYSEYYSALAGAGGLTIAGVLIAIESGTIWLLIPTVLASLVAVVIGLITVAMRQALVVLLVMIAPLAIVAYILPNTESLFRKWKQLFIKMIVFYPMMSLLFGASNLAGWAIINSTTDGFVVLLGKAVQFFPLFFAWSLMKMSDTILGTISGKLTNLARPMLASNRAWAESHRALTRQRSLAKANIYTPSARLSKFLTNHRIAREVETSELRKHNELDALAYKAGRHYKYYIRDGKVRRTLSREGLEDYEMQARDMALQRQILNDKNNFNAGFGGSGRTNAENAVLKKLDDANIHSADMLFVENARSASIDYANAKGRKRRFKDAMNAHVDEENIGVTRYRRHRELDARNVRRDAELRYAQIADISGNETDSQYAIAEAYHAFSAQSKVRQGKFQTYFDLTVPTQDVVNRLRLLTRERHAAENIDAIIAGCRILNQRGDGKLLRQAIRDLTADDKIEVGTHASQALSGFVMFEVKDNDPFLRRFGKYINLETARYYDDKYATDEKHRRKRKSINLDEYVMGGYNYTDANGNVQFDEAKRGMTRLLLGTSFKGVEREAYLNLLEGVQEACGSDRAANERISKIALDAILANVVSDQFSYPSGSEQVNALAKFITGIKAKYAQDGTISGYEWDEDTLKTFIGLPENYQFGSDEEKLSALKEAKNIAFDRTRSFLAAQVPNQVATTKTDVLYPMKELFMLKAKEDLGNARREDGQAVESDLYRDWSRERNEEIASGFRLKRRDDGSVPSDEELFAHWLFRSSLKDSTRGGLAKTITRGYQGNTKQNLIDTIGYNDYEDSALINKESEKYAFNTNNQNQRQNGQRRNRNNTNNNNQTRININRNNNPDYDDEEEEEAGFIFDDYDEDANYVASGVVQDIFESYHDGTPAEVRGNIENAYNDLMVRLTDVDAGLRSDQKQALLELGSRLNTYSTLAQLQLDVESIINS